MDIYIAEPFSHEAVSTYKPHHFFMLHCGCHWEVFQQSKYDRSILQISARKLADNKGMTSNLAINKQLEKIGICFSQMRDPN